MTRRLEPIRPGCPRGAEVPWAPAGASGGRRAMRLPSQMYEQARALVAGRLGLDFPPNRQADLERGLLRAWRASETAAPDDYLARLALLPDGDPEWGRLAGHLTVGETYFFRDRACFEVLERQVLPGLIAARRSEGILRLRLWSAGCATGEEPYSLAILLDRLLPDAAGWALSILATDVNLGALEAARRGRYRAWAFRETTPWIQERYFHRRAPDECELDPRVRRMVTFGPLNLAEDGYPGVVTNTNAIDLILCRNVLMYFTRGAQRAAIARLQQALVPGGWLAVSAAEASAELFRPLAPVNFPNAILFRKAPQAADAPEPSAAGVSRLGSGFETSGAELPLPWPSAHGSSIPGPSPVARPPEAPSDKDGSLVRARALADQGNLEEARRLCEATLRTDRLDPDAYVLLAAIRQEQGDLPAALEALRRALYLAPDSPPVHFLLGTLLLRRGERRRGRRYLETVVDLLRSMSRDEPVPGGGGLTAGRLLETARGYLAVSPRGDLGRGMSQGARRKAVH